MPPRAGAAEAAGAGAGAALRVVVRSDALDDTTALVPAGCSLPELREVLASKFKATTLPDVESIDGDVPGEGARVTAAGVVVVCRLSDSDRCRVKLDELGIPRTAEACERAMRDCVGLKKWEVLRWLITADLLEDPTRRAQVLGTVLVDVVGALTRNAATAGSRVLPHVTSARSFISTASSSSGDVIDEDVLCDIVQRGASPALVDTSKRTALAYALQGRYERLALDLIDGGADVNRRFPSDYTPLILAAKNGLAAACARLVQAGALRDTHDWEGKSALAHAAEGGYPDACRVLLEAGSAPDVTPAQYAAHSHLQRSPLMRAAAGGHRAVCEVLMEFNADPDAKDAALEKTPAMYAAEAGRVECLQLLLAAAKHLPGHVSGQQKTLAMYAAASGLVGMLPTVLDIPYEGVATAATAAAATVQLQQGGLGAPAVASAGGTTLADGGKGSSGGGGGASADGAGGAGKPPSLGAGTAASPPLSPATRLPKQRMCSSAAVPQPDNAAAMLAVRGVDMRDAFEFKTALMYAAERGQVDACRAIIAAGADMDAQSRTGKTALTYAIEAGQSEDTAAVFIDLGAAVELGDACNRTPMMYAARFGMAGVVRRLAQAGASVNTAESSAGVTSIMPAVEQGHIEVIRALIELKADVNKVDASGKGPLFYCRDQHGAEIAQMLLEAGARVNAADAGAERTTLSYAAEHGAEDVCTVLLKAGGDMRKRDAAGKAAIHYAAGCGRAAICANMIAMDAGLSEAAGVTVAPSALIANYPDGTGKRPMHYAAIRFHEEARDTLVAGGSIVDIRDDEGGWTPLAVSAMWAAQHPQMLFCMRLVSAGARLLTRDDSGKIPLHHAVANGHLVTALALAGAAPNDVDAKDADRKTPLMYAIEAGNRPMCEGLVKIGAKVTPKLRVQYERKFGPLKQCVCQ